MDGHRLGCRRCLVKLPLGQRLASSRESVDPQTFYADTLGWRFEDRLNGKVRLPNGLTYL